MTTAYGPIVHWLEAKLELQPLWSRQSVIIAVPDWMRSWWRKAIVRGLAGDAFNCSPV
jgi:hypothetical protein